MVRRPLKRNRSTFGHIFFAVRHNGYYPHLLRESGVITLLAFMAAVETAFLSHGVAVAPAAGGTANALTAFLGAHIGISARVAGALLLGVFAITGIVVGLGLVSSTRRFPLKALVSGAAIAGVSLAILVINIHFFSGPSIPDATTSSASIVTGS